MNELDEFVDALAYAICLRNHLSLHGNCDCLRRVFYSLDAEECWSRVILSFIYSRIMILFGMIYSWVMLGHVMSHG